MQPASKRIPAENHTGFRRAHQPPALTAIIHFTVREPTDVPPEQTPVPDNPWSFHLPRFPLSYRSSIFIGMAKPDIPYWIVRYKPYFTYQYIINSNRILTAHRNRLPFCSRRRFSFTVHLPSAAALVVTVLSVHDVFTETCSPGVAFPHRLTCAFAAIPYYRKR